MTAADALNATLARELPAAWRCLSPLGRAAVFPQGIPFQAAQAKSARINATIGQLTDGRGAPMPLAPLAAGIPGTTPRDVFLYAPVDGPASLRAAWLARERRLAGQPAANVSLPIVTHGLTHGLSLLADLFVDPSTDVILPSPSWENYRLVFQLHARGRVVQFPFYRADGRFNVEALANTLRRVRSKALIVLNFPGNPTGYHPSPEEAADIVDVITAHPGPLVVATDDAYQGWVYEPNRHPRSLFWDLAERADLDRLLPVKVDGATKELVFFASRVGFLAHVTAGTAAEDALRSKMKFLIRGSVGSASGPALAMVEQALRSPDLDASFEERRTTLGQRFQTLKQALANLPPDVARVNPFHGAFFALLTLPANRRAEAVRQQLLHEHSVGTVAFPEVNALRLAYCSIHNDDLPALGETLAHALT